VGECFFQYRLTRVIPDKFQSAVKQLRVSVCLCVCFCHYLMNDLIVPGSVVLLWCISAVLNVDYVWRTKMHVHCFYFHKALLIFCFLKICLQVVFIRNCG